MPVPDDQHSLTSVLPSDDVCYFPAVCGTCVRDSFGRDAERGTEWRSRSFGACELSGDNRLDTGITQRGKKCDGASSTRRGEGGIGRNERLTLGVSDQDHRRSILRMRHRFAAD